MAIIAPQRLCELFVSKLVHIQLIVMAFFAHELSVAALFDDFALINHKNPVGVSDC